MSELLAGLVQGFAQSQKDRLAKEEEGEFRKLRVKMFQRQLDMENEAKTAQSALLDLLAPSSIPMQDHEGGGSGPAQLPGRSLTQVLASPEGQRLALQSGVKITDLLGATRPGLPEMLAGGQMQGALGGMQPSSVSVGPKGPEVTFRNPFDPYKQAQSERDETRLRQETVGASGVSPKQAAELRAERAKEEPKAKQRVGIAVAKADIVSKKIDQALAKAGFFTTGLPGKLSATIPGSPAFNLDKTVDTIKAVLGFQELQNMRESSPTGGALGQVAVKEIEFLQAAVASLDTGQSQDQLKQNLMEIKTHFDNWKTAVQQHYQETYGRPSLNGPGKPGKQDRSDRVIDFSQLPKR